MEKKEFFINAIRMTEVEGSTNIPTVLFYPTGGPELIGSAALATARSRHDINQDFKIDLGNIEPGSSEPKRTFKTASGLKKSALGLTADFLRELLRHVNQWLEDNGIKGSSIMLAEPLAMQTELVSADWLSNYRRNLERLLAGKSFETIDFLPEPFAVFQYYRYGIRHPVVADRTKHHALVIDFGGGTFDVCIIETTKEGNISQTGRNSRPLAASSEPVGGFYVNRIIAEELFRKYSLSRAGEAQFKKGMRSYNEWRKSSQDLSTLAEEYRSFVNNLHETIYLVENPKLTLCKLITNWALDGHLNLAIPINLPENPFSSSGKSINVQISGNELRDIFIAKVWEQRLKPVIRRALDRGKQELSGASISVVLLSGGSANIGWLRELLRRDFHAELSDAEILLLPDFQEVVARGLAVECARRFYNEEGDFSSVTYNRLCLVLNSDKSGPSLKPFRPIGDQLPNMSATPGVLLPSASILQRFIEKPMQWRVRLDRPPHRRLDYYFLRSSFNTDETESLQNIEEHVVYTPRECSFDANFKVQLLVKQDGTAIPKFIYKSGSTDSEIIAAEGKPFFLDMTYSKPGTGAKAYIGLDFGTSNTSISFVDTSSIQIYRKRSGETSWNELSDLVSTLPYPLAWPLGKYLGESDPSKLMKRAFDFVEASLAMASYLAYLEYCARKGPEDSKLFKGFMHMSAGPLWALLQDCLKRLRDTAQISSPYQELLLPEFFKPIDDAVSFFARYKHGKASESSVNTLRLVQILANISQRVFSANPFGFFEQVVKQRFGSEFEGLFRHWHGRPPFIKVSTYKGPRAFSGEEPFLVNLESCTALSLHPLVFLEYCNNHPDSDPGHCYLFDQPERAKGTFSFKAVGYSCTCEVSLSNQYRALAENLLRSKEYDPKLGLMQVGVIKNP